MADETPTTAPLAAAVQTPVDVPPEIPVEEKSPAPPPPPHEATMESVSVTEKQVPLAPQEVAPVKPSEEVIEPEKPVERKKIPESLISFKEESNVLADLLDSQRRALDELKQLVRKAIDNNEFTTKLPTSGTENPKLKDQILTPETDEINSEPSIWGIPLLKDERSDVILLKFLRARDFKVKDAFVMMKNTIRWRKDFGIDGLINEDLGDDLDKVVFMHGFDKDGHPVCYNVYGEFQNKELYQKTFGDEEKRTRFLRWRIQFLERSIRKLDFSPGGICTIFQVSDLKNSPGLGKGELRLATRQALQLLQDNYPEFVTKQEFINVPWWYVAFYTMISPFLTQRTKSKFVFASPAKTAETLFKYVAPEQVPIQYGGLSVDFCDCNPEFTMDDPASEVTIKPATKQTVEILVNEKCILVWELRVVGWEVTYSAEYVPNGEGYTIIIHKPKKMTPTDEPVVSNSFKIRELGKILLTIDNPTSKKKKLLYRFNVKPLCD